MSKSPLIWFAVILLAIGLFSLLGPAEKTLGANVRIVYLHGAWVWAALLTFAAAGAFGGLGLVFRKRSLQLWSRALGRTGLFFWITYLPVSMWAMKTSWNGLFLAEPRWRLAVVFAITGLLLQIGVSLLENPAWAAAVNLFFTIALFAALSVTPNVMHPPSPIMTSEATRIRLYFAGLVSLTLLLAWQVARYWHARENIPSPIAEDEPY